MNLQPDWFEDQRGQSEVMDYMDIDQVVEVPDTPERFISSCNNDGNAPGNQSDGSSSCRVITKDSINQNPRNESREKGKSVNFNRRLFVRPDNNNNINSSTSKNLLTTLDNALNEKGKTLCNSTLKKSTFQESSSFVDLTEQNVSDNVFGNRKHMFSSNSFPEIDVLDTSRKLSGLNNADKFGQRFDRGKGVIRQKRLVRNGCISPHNIAKSKEVTKKDENGNLVKEKDLLVNDLITEDKSAHGIKGKGVSFHSSFCEETDSRNRHMSQRSSLISKESTKASNNLGLDTSDEWITTHKTHPPLTHTKNSNIYNHFEDLEINSTQRVSNPSDPMSRRAHQLGQFKERAQLTKRQREGVVFLSNNNIVESEVPRGSNDCGEPSTSRSIKNKNSRGGGCLDSVIALDEVSPENRGSRVVSDEDPGVRALQVEADEMLARELQEQLYNEELASAFGANEMDQHLAWATAMQQEHTSHAIPAYRPASRAPSVSNLYQNSRSNSSRNNTSSQRGVPGQTSTSTRLARLRGRFPGRARSLSSSTTPSNSIFPPNMDLDMRMQILEALEAFSDVDVPNDLLHTGRDFNENDYEMLLALDDNNHQHGGATHAQINNLPESTVQAENLKECAICLETPTIGETIRHLPCLHGFHKECIDEWLRRKTSCPVCKSSVT
ncbi:hypothetical protein L1887_07307 [Cichorium endivia]|nr:hypothetical protein L1887_07307 [Cichorium endivia]